MEKTGRVAVIGRSMHMAGLAASLRTNTALEVERVYPDSPIVRQAIDGFDPDVVILDLVEPHPELTMALLQKRPGVLLLGMDPSRDEMLVLSSEPVPAEDVQDLFDVVNRWMKHRRHAYRENDQQTLTNGFEPKRARFIEKETKVKRLNKRTRILLGIVGGIVVIIALVLVLSWTSVIDLPLQGTLATVSTRPLGMCVLPGQTVSFDGLVGYALSLTRWSSTNTAIMTVPERLKVTGVSRGDAQVKIKDLGVVTLTYSDVHVHSACPPWINLPPGTQVKIVAVPGGTWTSEHEEIATVGSVFGGDGHEAMVTGIALGQTYVIWTGGGVREAIHVIVTNDLQVPPYGWDAWN